MYLNIIFYEVVHVYVFIYACIFILKKLELILPLSFRYKMDTCRRNNK